MSIRVVLFSDLHLEAGQHLGTADDEFDNSRMRDAVAVLDQIAAEECDVLIFAGDMGRTAAPGPLAYRIFADALRASPAKAVGLCLGNHDWTGRTSRTSSCLHVVSRTVPRVRVFDQPGVSSVQGLQLGVLPWTPPSRMFAAAPHSPSAMNRQVADSLQKVARGLAAKLDPAKPSLLVGHWLVAGSKLPTGTDVIEAAEPLIDPHELGGRWDAAAFGHNHVHGEVSPDVWSIGPPMRSGFGEADVQPGYVVMEWLEHEGVWSSPRVEQVPTNDRKLVTLDLDADEILEHGRLYGEPELEDAVVRVRVTCRESQRALLDRAMPAVMASISERAFRVIGPQTTVERERRQRSELTTDTDPKKSLMAYLDAEDIRDPVRTAAVREAETIMGARS